MIMGMVMIALIFIAITVRTTDCPNPQLVEDSDGDLYHHDHQDIHHDDQDY